MRQSRIGVLVILVLAVAFTGCAKKVTDESQNVNTMESLAPAEDASQLPAAQSNVNLPAAPAVVEPLPIEPAPVTQAVAPALPVTADVVTGAVKSLSPTQIQTALKNAGLYTGNIDGKIGPASKKAIEAFQKSNGLKADGKVGPKTIAAMEKYLTGPALSTEAVNAPSTGTSTAQ